MSFENKTRYRKKVIDGMEIFDAKRINTISYRRKRHCSVSRANIGLLVHCMSQYVHFKVQT